MTLEQMLARQQELVNAARNAHREMNEEEQREFDELQRKIDAENMQQGAGEGQTAGGQRSREGETDPDAGALAERAVAMERRRVNEITSLCRNFAMDPQSYIAEGRSVEETRAAVLEELRKRNPPSNVRMTKDEGDKFRERATDGLVLRSGTVLERPAEGAREMSHMSLRAIGEECLVMEGYDASELRRMSSDELFNKLSERQFYNPSAAFPAILDSTARKSIVEMYNHVPTTFQEWVTIGSKPDFKEDADHSYVINSIGDFLEVPENGELKNMVPETKLLPTSKLKTYGRQFSMSRQAFINDDIGVITRMPGIYASKAKKTIDKMVYEILFNNGKIFDGVSLFDEKHGNLVAAGAKPSVTALQEMVTKLSLQKDQFGEPIYVTPESVLVPVGYAFDLYAIMHSVQTPGNNNNDANYFAANPMKVIQSPMLNALAGKNTCPWFVVADKYSAPSIGVDYLNGQQLPTVRRMETPGVLGFIWDVYIDAGIWVKDFRGIVKNTGVKL